MQAVVIYTVSVDDGVIVTEAIALMQTTTIELTDGVITGESIQRRVLVYIGN